MNQIRLSTTKPRNHRKSNRPTPIAVPASEAALQFFVDKSPQSFGVPLAVEAPAMIQTVISAVQTTRAQVIFRQRLIRAWRSLLLS